jgi:hypothetical protein
MMFPFHFARPGMPKYQSFQSTCSIAVVFFPSGGMDGFHSFRLMDGVNMDSMWFV